MSFREVQGHGFSWEKDILINVYGANIDELKKIKYTNKFDLPAELNKLDNVNLSIKTTGNLNSICMADCLRLYDIVNDNIPFHMIIIHYEQDDTTNTKNVIYITELDLTSSKDLLFGSITRDDIEQLTNMIKSIPQKRKPTEEERKMIYEYRDNLQERSGSIRLDIKCNSTQSRLQCSFNRFISFMDNNPNLILHTSNDNNFRGGQITQTIKSKRRTFKKKE